MDSKAQAPERDPADASDASPSPGGAAAAPQPDTAPGLDWKKVIALAVVLLGAYLIVSASSSLVDEDEPHYARPAIEMLESGDWLVPRFNSELRPDKPPMTYWLMAIAAWAFGKAEVVFRSVSALAVVLTAVLTALMGSRVYNGRVGLWAMIVVGTCGMVAYMGTAARTDPLLLLFITLSMWAFVEIIYRGPKLWLLAVIALAMACAQLVKGPVGLVVPLLCIGGTKLLGRDAITLGRRFWWGLLVAALAGIAAFVAWGLPANLATDGRLAEQALGTHIAYRLYAPMQYGAASDHSGHEVLNYLGKLGYYAPMLLMGLLPWALLFPLAVRLSVTGGAGDRRATAIVWGWVLPTVIFMSLVATKLPHYILPTYPALAMVIGCVVVRARRADLPDLAGWWRSGLWIFVPGMIAVVGGLAFLGIAIADGWGRAGPLVAAAAAAGWTLYVGIVHWRGQARRTTDALPAGWLAGMVLVALLAMPTIERHLKPSPELAHAVNTRIGPDVPVACAGYFQMSLVHYLDRPPSQPIVHLESADALQAWLDGDQPRALIVTGQRLEQWLDATPQSLGRHIQTIQTGGAMGLIERRQLHIIALPGG